MPNSDKRSELQVGLFIFIGLALLAGLIIQFGRFADFFGGSYPITVVFDDASGVIKGSEVRMGGARIGRVAKLPVLNDAVRVEVELAITDGIQIPAGSAFQIESATLLGDKLIVIIPPEVKTGLFIAAGSRHRGAGPTGLDALQNTAQTVSKDVVRILGEAEATLTKIDTAVEEIHTASRQVTEAVSKVNRSILAKENLAHFDRTLANLADVSDQWKEASGQLEPTIADAREAIGGIQAAAARAEATLQHADEAITGLKPALEGVPAAVSHISDTAKKAGDALDRMEEGKGLLGTVANDPEVSTDAKVFISNLRRFGILRYRNAEPVPEDDPRNRYRGKRR